MTAKTKHLAFLADADLAAVILGEAATQGIPTSQVIRRACRAHFALDAAEVDGRFTNRFRTRRVGSAATSHSRDR